MTMTTKVTKKSMPPLPRWCIASIMSFIVMCSGHIDSTVDLPKKGLQNERRFVAGASAAKFPNFDGVETWDRPALQTNRH
jgi:hypothetical protein